MQYICLKILKGLYRFEPFSMFSSRGSPHFLLRDRGLPVAGRTSQGFRPDFGVSTTGDVPRTVSDASRGGRDRLAAAEEQSKSALAQSKKQLLAKHVDIPQYYSET